MKPDQTPLLISEVTFLVTDVETTGSNPASNRVTDICSVALRDGEVLQEVSSLVNPRQHIPSMIQKMTGITDAMVYNAPSESDVFRRVHRMFATASNPVFVAHNVQFDWGFVSHAMARSGVPPADIQRLCTYRLAKRLLPRHKRFNLGALAEHFDIKIAQRHRAQGDAWATVKILEHFLEILQEQFDVQTLDDVLGFQYKAMSNFKAIPKGIERLRDRINSIPEEPGVYRYMGKSGEMLYIGKAKSLKNRVSSYFQQGTEHSKKIAELVKQVHDIEWTCTGSELSALLLESKLIKEHRPRYNTMIKKYRRYPFLRLHDVQGDGFPRLDYTFEIYDDGAEYFGPFSGSSSVEDILETIAKSFTLRTCADPEQPDESITPCFYHKIKRCDAPCASMISPEEYAKEVQRVRDFLSGKQDGIVDVLRNSMVRSASEMNFEEAAEVRNRIAELERVFYRQQHLATSVNENNVAIVLPAPQAKKVEVFFIRHGRLAYQRMIGKKIPYKELQTAVEQTYFDGSVQPEHCQKEEIDEIRIIASWIHRHRHEGEFVYCGTKTVQAYFEEICDKIFAMLNMETVYVGEEDL